MTNDALEKMEAGGVVMAKVDWCNERRKFWKITLFLSIAVMAISLLVFCKRGKPNNMEDSTEYAIIFTAKYLIIQYAVFGASIKVEEMWGWMPSSSSPPPEECSPAERAWSELAFVVFICVMTLGLGKVVEVFFFTMSSIIGLIAISHLFYPTPDHKFEMVMKHFWFIVGLGIVMGLICLIPNLFFFLGWFSIFVLIYVFIVHCNFPDKTLVEVFSIVSEDLNLS